MKVTLKTNPIVEAWYWNGERESLIVAPKWIQSRVLYFPIVTEAACFNATDYTSGLWVCGPHYILSDTESSVVVVTPSDFDKWYRVL